MGMKRKVYVALLTGLLVMSLTGCYSREDVDAVMQDLIKVASGGEAGSSETPDIETTGSQDDATEETTAEGITEETTAEGITENSTEEEARSTRQDIYVGMTLEEIENYKAAWKTAYQNIVDNYCYASEWPSTFSMLVDMEEDGVPELIIQNFDSGEIYTYENGQAVGMNFEVYSTQKYYYIDHTLVVCGYGMWAGDGVKVSFLKKENGQLRKEEYDFYGEPDQAITVEYTDAGGNVSYLDYETAKATVEAKGMQVTYTVAEYEVDFLVVPYGSYVELDWYDWSEGSEGITRWN